MKKIYILFLTSLSLVSCSTWYTQISLKKIDKERKQIAQRFVETYLQKCADKDYSEFTGFNISKSFSAKLVSDSLKDLCNGIQRKEGNLKIEKLVSVHSPKSPKDFIDVFNFQLKINDAFIPYFLHLGVYRDQNYITIPFSFTQDENYFTSLKKMKKKWKK